VAVLLEEHPLEDEREGPSVLREIFRAAREIDGDRVGFGEYEAIVVEHRCAPVGVDLEKFRSAAFALQDINFDDVAGDAELGEQQADFVGVPGLGDVVQPHN
jgi:hypothetical protein